MQYFDLHCHPGLKTLFLPQNGSQFSAWDNISAAKLFGNILSSQSSLEQLSHNGDIPLVCVTLHPPEAGMIDQCIIRLGAAILFRQIMDPARLTAMYDGADGYSQVFGEDLANLLAPPRATDNIPPEHKVVFLTNWADYNPADPGTVHVVFNIEGGHSLYDDGNTLSDPQKALDNLKAFLQKGFLTMYITPTHLTPNQFINHAYGNKILTKGPLLPQGLGITDDGRQLIDYAYGQGLLIDAKHMSLVARKEFYLIRDKYYPDKPIIASHMGLTGMPASQYLDWCRTHNPIGNVVELMSYKYPGVIPGTSFYPLSINLFNEDVVAILNSGGLIGLSMDVRILGGKDTIDVRQYDYLSAAEYALLSGPDPDGQVQAMADALWAGDAPAAALPQDVPDQPTFAQAIAEEMAEIMPVAGVPPDDRPNFDAHAQLLANHLIKIFQITQFYALPLPWGQVCIGSDFDGLVEAVDCCQNSTEFSLLAPALEQQLVAGAIAAGLDLQMDAAQIVEQFCYTNAFNFFNRHFG